jgi:dynein heavy chain
LKTAEEEVGSNLASQMLAEPYFVDFLRDAPEATGELQPAENLQSKFVF